MAALPGAGFYLSAGVACALLPVAARRWRGRVAGLLVWLIAGLLIGAANAAMQAQWRLNDALADEMCIRDRPCAKAIPAIRCSTSRVARRRGATCWWNTTAWVRPVSYTHLAGGWPAD